MDWIQSPCIDPLTPLTHRPPPVLTPSVGSPVAPTAAAEPLAGNLIGVRGCTTPRGRPPPAGAPAPRRRCRCRNGPHPTPSQPPPPAHYPPARRPRPAGGLLRPRRFTPPLAGARRRARAASLVAKAGADRVPAPRPQEQSGRRASAAHRPPPSASFPLPPTSPCASCSLPPPTPRSAPLHLSCRQALSPPPHPHLRRVPVPPPPPSCHSTTTPPLHTHSGSSPPPPPAGSCTKRGGVATARPP